MRTALVIAAALVAAPISASTGPALAGVSDEETTISGAIEDFHVGKGDVIFVRDRTNRWFRVALNEGCLDGASGMLTLSYDTRAPTARIDRMTRINIHDGVTHNCMIDSIRRSVAPPQVDSSSPITLD